VSGQNICEELTERVGKGEPFGDRSRDLLRDLRFLDPPAAWKNLGQIWGQANFSRLFPDFFPRFCQTCARSFDPDQALNNFERFSSCIYDKNYLYTILSQQLPVLESLLAIFSGSQFLTDFLLKDPSYFDQVIRQETTFRSRMKEELERDLSAFLASTRTSQDLMKTVRRFKNREILRIGLRDLMRYGDLTETMEDLSNLADVCVQAILDFCLTELTSQYGRPIVEEEDSQTPCEFTVIGLGKLGGRELNFSSDIDLIYLYSSDKGATAGIPAARGERVNAISNHEFCTKLAQMITRYLNEITPEGQLFRVDLNLRPEGHSGDIANSLRSMEIYYESWGQTWERQVLIKARRVAGSENLFRQFLVMVNPFSFRKHLDFGALHEIREMKEKINRDLAGRGAGEGHVKLGYGGIREVEFIVQAFQLIYGGRDRWLQQRNTLRALHRLSEKGYITYRDYADLSKAYGSLRELEHRIQIQQGRQTHEIPRAMRERAVLARKMGIEGESPEILSEELLTLYRFHTGNVRRVYDQLFSVLPEGASEEEDDIALLLEGSASSGALETLRGRGFQMPERAFQNLQGLYQGPPFSHPSAANRAQMRRVISRLLACGPTLADPDFALNHLEKFVNTSGLRESLTAMLAERPLLLEHLLSLFASSEFLSSALMQNPELVDLVLEEIDQDRPVRKEELSLQLSRNLQDASTYEDKLEFLRVFKKAAELRIALRDLQGKADLTEVMESLSDLGDVLLESAIGIASEELEARYGLPELSSGLGRCRFAVIALGKYGGRELSFGSDLDVVFVYEGEGESEISMPVPPGGLKREDSIGNQLFFTKLGEKIVQALSGVTRMGHVYRLDLRLRPEGEKGPLVVSLETLEEYHRCRAALWEGQSWLKARPAAGDPDFGEIVVSRIQEAWIAKPLAPQAAEDLKEMRQRMEVERVHSDGSGRHIKLGPGGIVDIEFITQYLQLKHGGQDPDLRTPSTLESLRRLARGGYLGPDECCQLQEAYLFLRGLENRLRIFQSLPTSVLPSDSEHLRILARRLGYPDGQYNSPEAQLLKDYDRHTSAVRQIFMRVFV